MKARVSLVIEEDIEKQLIVGEIYEKSFLGSLAKMKEFQVHYCIVKHCCRLLLRSSTFHYYAIIYSAKCVLYEVSSL